MICGPLIKSVAPQVYGYDDAKLGLICSLVGAQTRWDEDGQRIRGESHAFLLVTRVLLNRY